MEEAARVTKKEFKIPKQWRPQKHCLKSEFAFLQSLSQLLQLIYFVKCKQTLFEPNSQEPYSSSERERKFSHRLFMSSIKREIRHFLLYSCSDGKELYKKAWCTCRVIVVLPILCWRSCCCHCGGILKVSNIMLRDHSMSDLHRNIRQTLHV